MVHRQLAAALAGLLAAVPAAHAAGHKVAIGHYQWSTPTVNVDLGQRVTWYWVGPDTMHSVTGTSVNDSGWDSDPRTSEPHHALGDHYSLTFSQPGTYTFHCKLHSQVRGTIVVSAAPGDPADDPDPVPALNVDITPPYLAGLRLHARRLRFSLDEAATLDAELYRGGRYAGYEVWHGHVGYNDVGFATRAPRLRKGGRRLAPGRYVARVTATDAANNAAAVQRLHFTVGR